MKEHTKPPYQWHGHNIYPSLQTGQCIAFVNTGRPDATENAAFIVTACNAHEDLVQALKSARSEMKYLYARCGHIGPFGQAWEDVNRALKTAKGTAQS
jgi:hemolysin-activating ACP:hemolysin acyltransferase